MAAAARHRGRAITGRPHPGSSRDRWNRSTRGRTRLPRGFAALRNGSHKRIRTLTGIPGADPKPERKAGAAKTGGGRKAPSSSCVCCVTSPRREHLHRHGTVGTARPAPGANPDRYTGFQGAASASRALSAGTMHSGERRDGASKSAGKKTGAGCGGSGRKCRRALAAGAVGLCGKHAHARGMPPETGGLRNRSGPGIQAGRLRAAESRERRVLFPSTYLLNVLLQKICAVSRLVQSVPA